jgi:hypothetical protein
MIFPTFLFAFVFNELVYIGMTVIFLYHLWGFLLTVVFINIYFSKKDFSKLIMWFIFLSTLHLFLINFQIGGVIGHLWPKTYQASYGEESFSGTLGPNRITPGIMTFFGVVLSMYLIIDKFKYKGVKSMAIVNIALAIPVILMVGSRTTFFSLLIFLIVYVVIYSRRHLFLLFLAMPLVFLVFMNLGENQKERISENFERNQNKLLRDEKLSEIDFATGYSNLGSGRYEILESYIPYLIDNYYIIPFGIGFNNRIYANSQTSAASAHNVYLSLINEVGLVGLYFYVSWLFGYIKSAREKISLKYLPAKYGLVISLVLSMIVSLFSGEHLYIYRPCFALMGAFIFVNNAILKNNSTN